MVHHTVCSVTAAAADDCTDMGVKFRTLYPGEGTSIQIWILTRKFIHHVDQDEQRPEHHQTHESSDKDTWGRIYLFHRLDLTRRSRDCINPAWLPLLAGGSTEEPLPQKGGRHIQGGSTFSIGEYHTPGYFTMDDSKCTHCCLLCSRRVNGLSELNGSTR